MVIEYYAFLNFLSTYFFHAKCACCTKTAHIWREIIFRRNFSTNFFSFRFLPPPNRRFYRSPCSHRDVQTKSIYKTQRVSCNIRYTNTRRCRAAWNSIGGGGLQHTRTHAHARRRHSYGHWPWYQTHSIAPITYTRTQTNRRAPSYAYIRVCVCVSLYRISTCPNSSPIHLHHHYHCRRHHLLHSKRITSSRHCRRRSSFPSYFFSLLFLTPHSIRSFLSLQHSIVSSPFVCCRRCDDQRVCCSSPTTTAVACGRPPPSPRSMYTVIFIVFCYYYYY